MWTGVGEKAVLVRHLRDRKLMAWFDAAVVTGPSVICSE